jgi:hypothetical protein
MAKQRVPKCKVCKGRGFLIIFNTDSRKLEIQRCDNCQIFENDEIAEQEALKFFDKLLQ